MKAYKDLSKEELRALQTELQAQYEKLKESNIKLDMSRGKPAADQLDLSVGMLDVLNSKSAFKGLDNVDEITAHLMVSRRQRSFLRS